jgi:hypothetical protein
MDLCFIHKFKNNKEHDRTINNQSKRCTSCKASLSDKDGVYLDEFYVDNNYYYKFDKIIDDLVESTLFRYFAVSNLDGQKDVDLIRKKLKYSSYRYLNALDNLIATDLNIHCIFVHHGIYVPQGLVELVAKKYSINFYTWWRSYRENTVLFSKNMSYHSELPNIYSNKLNLISNDTLIKGNEYLNKRILSNNNDNMIFSSKNGLISNCFLLYLRILKRSKKIFSVFTNVGWDAKAHYSSVLFENQESWLSHLIHWANKNNNIILIIRIHPAEKKGIVRSRENLYDFLKVLNLKNVILLKPDFMVSSYKLAQISNLSLTFNTKFTIEAAAMGVNTIAAGDSWGRNVNAYLSANDKDEYFKIIFDLVKNNKFNNNIINARKLFSYIFIVRMIEILDERNFEIELKFKNLIENLYDVENY